MNALMECWDKDGEKYKCLSKKLLDLEKESPANTTYFYHENAHLCPECDGYKSKCSNYTIKENFGVEE